MNDLISRQAAIDFIAAWHLCNPNEPRWSDNEVVNFLKSRPSAQPEITLEQVNEFCEERGFVVLTKEEYQWLKSLKSKAEEYRWNGGGNY